MFFATQFNIDPQEWSDRTGLECKDPSLAQQQFKDECDINILMGRYLETGVMPQVETPMAYGDFTGVFDFQSAMNAVRTAEGMFGQLPARIKNRFDNNPQKLLDFLALDENRDEAEFLGLVNKPQEKPDATRTQETPTGGTQTTAGTSGTQANPNPATPVQGT